MVYGYLRVSTDKQTVENQRYEINRYCKQNSMAIDKWVEETISSRKELSERKLGGLIDMVGDGDLIIASEISRLGRNLLEVMGMLNKLLLANACVQTIKDRYRLGADIQSKVLAFAFGLSAEIERQLISQRTKEALARAKAEGICVGRPIGAKNKRIKLSGKKAEIEKMLKAGISKRAIAEKFGVRRFTLFRFLRDNNMKHGVSHGVSKGSAAKPSRYFTFLDKKKKLICKLAKQGVKHGDIMKKIKFSGSNDYLYQWWRKPQNKDVYQIFIAQNKIRNGGKL